MKFLPTEFLLTCRNTIHVMNEIIEFDNCIEFLSSSMEHLYFTSMYVSRSVRQFLKWPTTKLTKYNIFDKAVPILNWVRTVPLKNAY